MSKPKRINAYAYNVEFVDARNGEVTLLFRATRKAPRGSRISTGKTRMEFRLEMDPGTIIKLARVGKDGLAELARAAQVYADNQKGHLDRLRQAVTP